jgi:hypothetical protein
VRLGVRLVSVLVRLERAGDLLGEAVGHAVVRLRRLGRHLGGRHDHLGAVGAQQVDLLLRHLVGHHRDHPVAPERGSDGESGARVAAGGLHDRAAGLQQSVALGRVDQRDGGAVLDRAARVERLDLRNELRPQVLAEPRQPYERRLAHGVED